MSAQYPALAYLIGAYFHQDWEIEGATTDDIVDRYLRENDPGKAGNVREEINRLLDSAFAEADLRSLVMNEMSSGYDPYGEEISVSEWLMRVRERLARPQPSDGQTQPPGS